MHSETNITFQSMISDIQETLLIKHPLSRKNRWGSQFIASNIKVTNPGNGPEMTATFNTYYLRKMFNRPIKETANDKMTAKGFWRTLIVRDGILITADT